MHPLRVIVDHHVILISGLLVTVSGDRNRKRYPQSWQGSLVRWNASSSDRGKTTILTTGTRRARANFQKGVSGMWSRQKACHRAMVARSTPKSVESSRIRRGGGPCRIAL